MKEGIDELGNTWKLRESVPKKPPYVLVILSFLVAIPLVYGAFLLYRWFNWEFAYRDKVEVTIKEMVKKECLTP